MGTFKDLSVWKDAVQLAVCIYNLTEQFPTSERFGLTSQIRRSTISISSNIAEGKGRSSDRELCRFIDIAIGSLFEGESQLEVAIALGFVKRDEVRVIFELIDKTGRGLTKLKRARSNRPV